MYAIVETGGKQFKVTPGQTVDVELLNAAAGDKIELDKVLMIADGENVTVGAPTVAGAKIMATSQGEKKGEKIIIFKFKSKVHYRNKTGHRQRYTRLTIDSIVKPGETSEVKASGS